MKKNSIDGQSRAARVVVITFAFLLFGILIMVALYTFKKQGSYVGNKSQILPCKEWRYGGSRQEEIGTSHYFAVGDGVVLVLLEMNDEMTFSSGEEALCLFGYERDVIQKKQGVYFVKNTEKESGTEIISFYEEGLFVVVIGRTTDSLSSKLSFLTEEIGKAKGNLGDAKYFQEPLESDELLKAFLEEK